MFGLDTLELRGCVVDGFVPAHFLPRIGDLGADHRLGDAVLVGGVAPRKTTFHARVTFVGLAIFPRHHANHGVALHFGFEAATHTAVSAGGDQAVLGLAEFNDGFFLQRSGRASLDASAAGHAFAVHERLVLTWRHAALKTTSRDGEGEGALGFFASTYTAVAHNAFAGVIGEIGVGLVFLGVAVVGTGGLAHAVAHIAQSCDACHVLQLTVAVGAAGQAVQRMVRDVQLHHAFAQVLQLGGLGMHHHASFGGCGARGRKAFATINFHQAQTARTKRLQAVGRAQLGHLNARFDSGTHERGAFGHADVVAVNAQLHSFRRGTGRGAVVSLLFQVHQHGVSLKHLSLFGF